MRDICYNKDMKKPLYKNCIATPIGQMMSISDAEFLYRLDFTDQKGFSGEDCKLGCSSIGTSNSGFMSTRARAARVFCKTKKKF